MELKLAEFEYDDTRSCSECGCANSHVIMKFENVSIPFCKDCFKKHIQDCKEFFNGEKPNCWFCTNYVMDAVAGCHVCTKGQLREIGTDAYNADDYCKCSDYIFKGNG